MNYITGKHMSRRTLLRGMGAAVSLPLLDAMIPANRLWASTEAGKAADMTRLVCIEQVHGAAGCNDLGASLNLWSPAKTGRDFDLSPTSLNSLEPFRDYLTIVSDTDCREADAKQAKEIGGDHFRTTAVFLTQAPTSIAGLRSTSSSRNALVGTLRSLRCSCRSNTSIRPVDVPTDTLVSTPTRSAGHRRLSRSP